MSDERLVPSKRLRNWHRKFIEHDGGQPRPISLKAFARQLGGHAVSKDTQESRIYRTWLANKAAAS